jgi:hypothetical protein
MNSWLKWMGTAALLAGLTGCPGTDTGEGETQLSISPVLKAVDDKGQNTSLRVTAIDKAGKAGVGDVTVSTSAGFLGNAEKSITLTLDADGKATTSFSCPVAQDQNCKGTVRVEGSWGTVTAGANIQVGSTVTNNPDAGTNPTPDAGTGGNGGGGDPVTEAGKPANIVFDPTGTKAQLGIRSVGLETSTPVTFIVLDIEGKPVPNATVTFSVTGPAGVSLVPSSKQTNSTGKATTVLQSGDEVGVATVSGRITTETGGILVANTQAIPIVGARVSDRGFVVECAQLVLSANMTETPPRKDTKTGCTANLSDRFTSQITLPTTVTWYSEAGAITSPVINDETGLASTTFSTAGKWPPVPVEPLTAAQSTQAEPSYLNKGKTFNPRDMLVTVIAVTSGEEEFYDGSGVSNGVKNGEWNKGEWFVDTPEPFVDANDNQAYDSGEAFIDTERRNCDTGAIEPKNGKWDGPNGCWDGVTMLWRSTHILYSGYNSEDEAIITYTPPASVAKKSELSMAFGITDAYLNIISPDAAKMLAVRFGKYGDAAIGQYNDPNVRTYGFQILHERIEVTPDSTQPRGYRTVGICDPGKIPASGASSDPKLARCVWQYRFGRFNTHTNGGIALLSGSSDTDPTTNVVIQLAIENTYGWAASSFITQMK